MIEKEKTESAVEKPEEVVPKPHVEAQASVQLPTNSGSSGINGPFPAELNGWNWGAFFMTWIWGIGNSSWFALIGLMIPFYIITMPLLGVMGNKLAWQHRRFESVAQFKAVQKSWAIAGLIYFILEVFLIGSMLYGCGRNGGC